MKISKSIFTSALAVVVALSIIMGTLLYAYQYTSSNMSTNNSFQGGNGKMPHGQFPNKSGSPNGSFNKPGN